MNHQTFLPQESLKEWVKCYWNLESAYKNTPLKNTIIPDGTMKLIFHYGDTYRHHPNNQESIILPKCFLIGQLTKPYVVEPLGVTGSFVVRFQPNGFSPFANIPIKEIQNTAVPLKTLFGNDGIRIGEQILTATSTAERIELIEEFLINRLTNKATIDLIIKTTVDTILEANGQCSIHTLSEQNNTSRRQLTRKFSSTIGLSPKQLSKTVRIQNALKTLLKKEVTSLTDLAYENEYFDQAHFIKDFKEFTGLTPKEFYGDDLKMSLIFDNET
ncbi:DUF6597 domain-containing transcriptional factor [Wenyingzhuangia sp. IMCC45574]